MKNKAKPAPKPATSDSFKWPCNFGHDFREATTDFRKSPNGIGRAPMIFCTRCGEVKTL